MKISEEKYLKAAIKEIKRYTKTHPTAATFYNDIETLNCKSLQDLSFHNDLAFFADCQFILNVIISIIAHPHLSNKGEDVVLRAEQVHSLTSEMFQKTIQDPQLWRNQNHEMVPAYVHYYQNVDELKIYENIFLIHLLSLIQEEISKYRDFYASMIKTVFDDTVLSSQTDSVQIAFEQLDLLSKKINKIKRTYFYKEVSKASLTLKSVHPTNILLKDRLYHHCYKFYKKLIAYQDKNSLNEDFSAYYYCLLFKTLKKNQFRLSIKNKGKDMLTNKLGDVWMNQVLTFYSKDFKIVMSRNHTYDGIHMQIQNRHIENSNCNTSTHLLFFDVYGFTHYNIAAVDKATYTTIESISLWNHILVDQDYKNVHTKVMNEHELMDYYFDSKLHQSKGSYRIYSTYCPVCKEKQISNTMELFQCSHCHSTYTFFNEDKSIWYLKLRRC